MPLLKRADFHRAAAITRKAIITPPCPKKGIGINQENVLRDKASLKRIPPHSFTYLISFLARGGRFKGKHSRKINKSPDNAPVASQESNYKRGRTGWNVPVGIAGYRLNGDRKNCYRCHVFFSSVHISGTNKSCLPDWFLIYRVFFVFDRFGDSEQFFTSLDSRLICY